MMIAASELRSYKLPAEVKSPGIVDRFLSKSNFEFSSTISTGGNS